HMISDQSLEELHAAGRALNLRWVAFGRDHYDVPDVLWPAACEIAQLVDSREIVRSLRQTGLRVHGGKPKKTWRQLQAMPAQHQTGETADWLRAVRPHFDDAAIEVLGRPSELVVMHLCRDAYAPDLGALAGGPTGGRVVHTVADHRYSMELVLPWDAPSDPAD
ncbi:MAG: DUF4031 domain-containing protein, partial [Acidimicrobiales bacterium]|nr:DUF4031 domain-containing protein [Acidimicrobiales bacterium]